MAREVGVPVYLAKSTHSLKDRWPRWMELEEAIAEQPGSPMQGGRRQILMPNVLGHPRPGNQSILGNYQRKMYL